MACEVLFDSEDLQLEYDEACDEVIDLLAELRAATLEVQQLSLRLKACRRTKTPFSTLPAAEEPKGARDLRQLFEWLAETVDLSHPPETLDVGFEVPIGGRSVHLHRVVQWPLATRIAPGGLKLTAPIQHQEALGQLLASTRAVGKVDSDALMHFLAGWDLIAGELTTAAHPVPEPSVLLAHRTSTQGILVATWPSKEALQVYAAPIVPQPGERVEVEYEGQCYVGILYGVDNGMASVRCDADPPGVMTVAPLSHVRRLDGDLVQEEALTLIPVAEREEVPLAKMHRRTKSSAL
mmetsp:Transcript_131081/g.184820  ORF Transcript_131081/g.184820 Transcript_131081/m.184820 type:complete len:294 (+) Transcript_131081:36-917(+)